jgi:hypothetical protein
MKAQGILARLDMTPVFPKLGNALRVRAKPKPTATSKWQFFCKG